MDEELKELGFTDEKEYFSLVSSVPLTSSRQLTDFNLWKLKDGTKDGLMKLFNNHTKGLIESNIKSNVKIVKSNREANPPPKPTI